MNTSWPMMHQPYRDDWDRISRINVAQGKKTGIPYHINSGLMSFGKYRFSPDGFVYIGKRKKPAGRYLRTERTDAGEVCLRVDRLDDVKQLEALRWRLLLRVRDVLIPELRRREEEFRRARGGRKFTGYHQGTLYQLKFEKGRVEFSDYQEVELEKKDPDAIDKVLDKLGRDWTPAEDDAMASFIISIHDRVARAYRAAQKVTSLLLLAIDKKLRTDTAHGAQYGHVVEVVINGRHYMTWIGHGGIFKSKDELIHLWPSPTTPIVNTDSATPEEAKSSEWWRARYVVAVS